MKKLILLLALSTTAAAQVTDADCKHIAQTAESVMISRQSGDSITQMIELTETKQERKMVIEAFETPKFITDFHKHRVEMKFRNKWALQCYKMVK